MRPHGSLARRTASLGRPVATVLVATALSTMLAAVGPASASVISGVFGEVLSKATGAPVAGATVSLPAYGLRTVTNPPGTFSFDRPLPISLPYRRVTVVVRARGFGTWRITGAPLYANDPMHLHVELRTQAFTDAVLTPRERARQAATGRAPLAPETAYTNTCTGWSSQTVPPQTIVVYSTTDGTSTPYDFVFYVTHVLPSEWIASWDADALGAGAIAAKTFGWYRALPGHAYTGGVGCADITDYTGDQVFDPARSYPSTDQAVYATYGTANWKNGGIWLSQYWAGYSTTDPCQLVTGTFAGRMSQWGTQNCALAGVLWPDIVTTFYPDTTWVDLHNLLLDPGGEDAQVYAWLQTHPSSYKRASAQPYEGAWWLKTRLATTVYQVRPFDGTPSSTYQFSVALKCPGTNTAPCIPDLKVIANGSTVVVMQKLSIIEPNDGRWRVYSMSPPASGISHTSVQVNIVASQVIGIDAAVLTGIFGGP
jgi:Carboxypeptidase regulatory-like domain/Stage II sporulation protein